MRILYLCHRVPFPPDKGEKIRAFYQLRALSTRHDVDLFTLADDPRDMAHQSALEAHCRHVTIARVVPKLARLRSMPYLLSGTPLTVPYFYSSALRRHIDAAVTKGGYDRVFVYCSAMSQYVPWNASIPVIIDLVDVDSDKWLQYATKTRFPFSMIYRKEGRDLRRYERTVSERATCVVVTTEREAQLAREMAPAARVHVVSVGVDTSYFAPAPTSPHEGVPTVIFTGDMSYFPNQDGVTYFVRDILPTLRAAIPNIRFLIVGRNPSRQIEALQRDSGVEVTGAVPDVRPFLAQASVAVAPLRIAAGVQNKILEAMSSGLPVVATQRASQGLKHRVAELVELGDSAEAFADRLLLLLRDPKRARELGLEGRRRVAAEYSWDASLRNLVRLVEHPTASTAEVSAAVPIDPAEVSASA